MDSYFPRYPEGEVISLFDAAFRLSRRGVDQEDYDRWRHARFVVERINGGHVPPVRPEDEDSGFWDAPTREELAEAAEGLYAAMPAAVRAAVDAVTPFNPELPPTRLFRVADARQRGVLVLVSLGFERVEGGWYNEGSFVPDARVSRFSADLRTIVTAERWLDDPDWFRLTRPIEGYWLAECGGTYDGPHIRARAPTECLARALLIVLRVYGRAAGLGAVDEHLVL